MQNSAPLHGIKTLSYFPWPFPERTGANRRFSSFVRWLSEAGADVTLALTGRPSGESTDLGPIHYRYYDKFTPYNYLQSLCSELLQDPNWEGYSQTEIAYIMLHNPEYWRLNPGYIQWLESLIRNVDVVTWEYSFGVEAIAPICQKHDKPLIITTHDHLARLHGKHPGATQLLQDAEVRALRMADACFTVSREDQETFRALGIDTTVTVNVGDTSLKKPGIGMENFVRQALNLQGGPICLFAGSMHSANEDAAVQVLAISQLVPEAQFILLGKCCPPYRQANFISLGEVDDFLYEALHQCATFIINPIRFGGGSSLKFFDALCYGKCIITTPIGARGHQIIPGLHSVVCGSTVEFAMAIRKIMPDRALRSAMGNAARTYACRHDVRYEFAPYASAIRNLAGKPIPTKLQTALPRRSLFLVDNNLSNRVGHHFTYAETLAAVCRKRGVDFKALVRKDCDASIIQSITGMGVFSRTYHEPALDLPFAQNFNSLNDDWDLLQQNITNYREMAPVLRDHASPGDIVFLPNAHYRQLLAVALHISEFSSALSPMFVCMLRYPLLVPGLDNHGKPSLGIDINTKHQLQKAFRELEKVASPASLRLVTDSRLLADEYQSLTSIPFQVLPIPHTTDERSPAGRFAGLPARNSAVRIVTLGDARKEKGFDLLPAIIKSVAKRLAPGTCEFVLHGYVSHPYHATMQPSIDQLRTMGTEVSLLERPLDSSEYRALLDSADIVLLPYDELTYHSRTSGPFIEAVCAGKVVVVTDSTWMTSEVDLSESCIRAKSGDADSFAEAISMAVGNLPTRLQSARTLASQFVKTHNPDSFLDALLVVD